MIVAGPPPSMLILTGASGFLGEEILRLAGEIWPDTELVALRSPRQGGIDLEQPDAVQKLGDLMPGRLPARTLLVHAAAAIVWDALPGLVVNAAMAVHVARWARQAGVDFSVLVSSVSVYPPGALIHPETPRRPDTLYGIGKYAAEEVWRLELDPAACGVIRFAGVWGWQVNPTLFWNRLLLSAAQGACAENRLRVHRIGGRRNYISVRDAAACVLTVGATRQSGSYLAAGQDILGLASYVEALQRLPGTRLEVVWDDSRAASDFVYTPSTELATVVSSFTEALTHLWRHRPEWTAE